MDWVRQQLRQGEWRQRIRNEEQRRLGVWLETDDEEEESFHEEAEGEPQRETGGSAMVNGRDVHIRRMTKEEFYHGAEENLESEMEEMDVEVLVAPAAAGASSSAAGASSSAAGPDATAEEYDYDWDSIALSAEALGAPGDDGYTSHMDVEQEESEEDDDMETEYGSLDLVNEDFSVFEELNPQEYDDYRFILLSESRGVEHYIVRKLAWLRSLPVTRDVWIGIQELFSMHKSIQLGGIETRKRAIDFLRARRRYHFWYDRGRVPPGENLEESDMPDEWIAAHYGWGEPTTFQPGEDAGEIASWSPSDAAEGEESEEPVRDERPPPVVNDEAAVSPSDGAAGTTSTTPTPVAAAPAATPKGKCGGKGRTVIYYPDPPHEAEADGHV
jgi:hypothetical protein